MQLVALVGVLLTACSPGADLPVLQATPQSAYRLGPGDRIRIIVYGDEPLSGDFQVSDQGNIALPLAGSVRAGGLSTGQLEREIADTLKRKDLVRDPSVAAEVVSYRPIFVLGEVSKPGQYPYQPGMTVLTAVAIAGGFTYRAVERYAAITRTEGGRAIEGRVTPQTYVAPGDVIRIFERRF